MPVTALAALPLVMIAAAADPAVSAGVPPRFSAGASFAIAQVAGSSGVRDEALSVGLLGVWRPRRFWALGARYSRAAVNHDYTQLQFESAYHRLSFMLEGRLPIGRRFDFIGWAGPEVTWLRSSMSGAEGGARDSGRLFLGPAFGGGAGYRISRVELQAEAAFGHREPGFDLAFTASLLWTWP